MLKQPVKIREISLEGDYEGWQFTARTNPPLWVVMDIASGDFERIVKGLVSVVKKWNFVNEDGDPLEEPSIENMSQLPIDLVMQLASAISKEIGKAGPN